jgi:nucleoside-diphosphate kinase
MAVERTLSIIKPDAVAANLVGQIYSRFEQADLAIVAAKMLHLNSGQAEEFYAVHKDRPFFKDLIAFMSSGPVMVQVLEGADAIAKNREVMGATNPKKTQCTVRMGLLRLKPRSRTSLASRKFIGARGEIRID